MQDSKETDQSFPVSSVNRVKRGHQSATYSRAEIYAILDASLVCHIAYVIEGRPYCTPTAFWREGNNLYWHGSSASRMVRAQRSGLDVCVTVTHLDALVMARSGLHHSINYRAVLAFGTARIVEDPVVKLRLMDNFIDRIFPGRSKLIRRPTRQELKAIALIEMPIETASAKVRSKHVVDEEEDYSVPAWSALYPVTQSLGVPSECPRQLPSLNRPREMSDFEPGTRFDDLMRTTYRRTFPASAESDPLGAITSATWEERQ